MTKIRVGVQLGQQHTTYQMYAEVVRQVDAMGVDTIWNWDHFLPPFFNDPPPPSSEGPPHGNHFEAWTLLTAMAVLTKQAQIGCLVTGNSYRNPALLATMAKTVDHISAGRLIVGLGAGWFETEYREYGYYYGTVAERLKAFEDTLRLVRQRWNLEKPAPVRGTIPILVGGNGEKVTLRLAAQYADMWNGGAEPDEFRHKCQVLDAWCEKVGRDPAAVERSLNIYGEPDEATYDKYVLAGAQHIILNVGAPWDLKKVEYLLRWREQTV